MRPGVDLNKKCNYAKKNFSLINSSQNSSNKNETKHFEMTDSDFTKKKMSICSKTFSIQCFLTSPIFSNVLFRFHSTMWLTENNHQTFSRLTTTNSPRSNKKRWSNKHVGSVKVQLSLTRNSQKNRDKPLLKAPNIYIDRDQEQNSSIRTYLVVEARVESVPSSRSSCVLRFSKFFQNFDRPKWALPMHESCWNFCGCCTRHYFNFFTNFQLFSSGSTSDTEFFLGDTKKTSVAVKIKTL